MKKQTMNNRLLFWSVEILVLACLVFVLTKIQFIFKPIVAFGQTVFIPMLIAAMLYYLLNPIVNRLEQWKIKRIYGILIVFVLLFGGIAFIIMQAIPSLMSQLAQLLKHVPNDLQAIESWINTLSHESWIKHINIEHYLKQMDTNFGRMLKTVMMNISSGMGSVISSVTSMVMTLVTAPLMLFYMLKDGNRFIPGLSKYLPMTMKDDAERLLHRMSQTLSSYIGGQAIECIFVAVFTFIGYKLVGVPYAFLFAVIAGATNMIPYLGPYLGLAPALITTLFISPVKAILCTVVVLIVQQIDGNIIYPNVIGKSLDIHPMTIIIILLIAGNIAGVFGMFLGVPIYAIAKTIFNYLYELYQLHHQLPTRIDE